MLINRKPDIKEVGVSFEEEMMNAVANKIKNTFDNLIIEALKRKGFDFKNRVELEEFIKSNCRCEDRVDLKQKTYFVNDIPFFLHCYENESEISTVTLERSLTFSAKYGSYAYL
jgi:hypothetical protein